MAQFNNTTKKDVKNLNPKQTVIIETVTTTENNKTKVVKNIYLGNWKRRQDAYYLGMVAEGMKEVRKGETTKSYRLLKLHKLLEEVGVAGYNTKTNWLQIEGYNDEEAVARAKEEAPAAVPPVKAEEVEVPEEEELVPVDEMEEVAA